MAVDNLVSLSPGQGNRRSKGKTNGPFCKLMEPGGTAALMNESLWFGLLKGTESHCMSLYTTSPWCFNFQDSWRLLLVDNESTGKHTCSKLVVLYSGLLKCITSDKCTYTKQNVVCCCITYISFQQITFYMVTFVLLWDLMNLTVRSEDQAFTNIYAHTPMQFQQGPVHHFLRPD